MRIASLLLEVSTCAACGIVFKEPKRVVDLILNLGDVIKFYTIFLMFVQYSTLFCIISAISDSSTFSCLDYISLGLTIIPYSKKT